MGIVFPMLKRVLLLITSFLGGFVVLSYELTAIRLIIPFFGSTQLIWCNIIGLVILALAIGYDYGGKIVDRYPPIRILYSLLSVISLFMWGGLLATIPVCELTISTLHSWAWPPSTVLFLGSLIAGLILFFIPMMLLGFITPLIIRLLNPSLKEIGHISGLVYCVSTFGSLTGIMVTTFVLHPFLGSSRSLYCLIGLMLTLLVIHMSIFRLQTAAYDH